VSTLVIATRNEKKRLELERLLALGPSIQVRSLAGLDAPAVVEDGETFADNARKKAREVAGATGLMTLADDSGLEVDALGGAPGVWSARFAGEGSSDDENNRLLLERLSSVAPEQRTARFRCVLAFADLEGPLGERIHCESGTCEGRIALAPEGEGGFGYDPLFVPSGYDRTLAVLGREVKDRISHRAAAIRAMQGFVERYLEAR
jgi:XTP/dITP diphosphohydrolase